MRGSRQPEQRGLVTAPIEPGVLPLFRIFVALEILLLVLRLGLEAGFRADFPLVGSPWPALVALGALLAYLCLPALEQRLTRAYLPIALVASAAITLLAAAHGLRLRVEAGIRAEELVRSSWVLIVVLVVPLIIVAWQYGVRWVLWFCGLTAAAELALMFAAAPAEGTLALAFLGIALARCVFFVPLGYAVAKLAQAQRRQRMALAEANARLARYAATLEELAVSRERNRLAYELHDTLAHGLSSLAIQLEAMGVLWQSQPDKARQVLAEALTGTRTALSDSRRAIGALRARPLEELGLARAVWKLAESTAASAGLELDLHVSACVEGLREETEHAVYRIAAEALANVARHAQAHHLTVRLEEDEVGVTLIVADDGRGFDAALAADDQRFGLYGMRERARLLGAELRVDSNDGNGTTVALTVRRSSDTGTDM